MIIDSDLVSWKRCDKNPIRVNFDCKKTGFELMGSTEVKNKFIDFNKSQIMLPKSCLFTLFPHFRDLRP